MLIWQLAVPVVTGAAALGLGGLITRRLLDYRSARTVLDAVDEAVPEHSMARYRPMARLLDSRDLEFLASRPGYRREMGTRLRDSRRRIFRMYLAELSADFQRLHAAARKIVADAPEEHAELIPMLVRQQLAFWRALAMIEVRLTLSWAGFGTIDAKGLLEIVEQLSRTVATVSPAPAVG